MRLSGRVQGFRVEVCTPGIARCPTLESAVIDVLLMFVFSGSKTQAGSSQRVGGGSIRCPYNVFAAKP